MMGDQTWVLQIFICWEMKNGKFCILLNLFVKIIEIWCNSGGGGVLLPFFPSNAHIVTDWK